MRKRKGFTLIELMVVVLIVAVLAAVIVPLMTSRVNKAKWSEAKAAMGQIATSIRAYVSENSAAPAVPMSGASFSVIGYKANELNGKYFAQSDYSVTACAYDATTGALTYTIQAATTSGRTGAPTGGPLSMTCDATGVTTFSATDASIL